MAVNVFPASGGSPIKSIQRGVAAAAGNVTISAVDISKATVQSFSTGSSGTVAATGSITGTLTPSGGAISSYRSSSGFFPMGGGFANYEGTRTISGGTTNLTVSENGAYLSTSTTLVVTGPCRWEVVEFN